MYVNGALVEVPYRWGRVILIEWGADILEGVSNWCYIFLQWFLIGNV
jgi:hypothetical protein